MIAHALICLAFIVGVPVVFTALALFTLWLIQSPIESYYK